MAPEIRRLADSFLDNPKTITVAKPATVATTITTGLAWVRPEDKREALRRLIRAEGVQNALIFCNRKADVEILYKSLKKHGFSAGALHGDMEQSQRFATLNAFKAGEIRLLVCSDVAARGLDISGISHVFNFDVPFRDEDYVHRIGRTGRAGREGRAFTLATPADAKLVAAIEKLTGKPIPLITIPGIEAPSQAGEIAEAASAKGRRRSRSGTSDESGRGGTGRRAASAAETARGGTDKKEKDQPEKPSPASRRAQAPAGEARREERRRDTLGPAPRGFGEEIPAFMTLRPISPCARRRPMPRRRPRPPDTSAPACPRPGRRPVLRTLSWRAEPRAERSPGGRR